MTLMEIIDKAEKIANYTACAAMLSAGVVGIYYLFKPELTKIKDYILNKSNNKNYQKD